MSSMTKDDLRKVFEICDVRNTGEISVSHLLALSEQHFGSSNKDLSLTVSKLCKRNDFISFPEFCRVFSPFLANQSDDLFKQEQNRRTSFSNGDQENFRTRNFKEKRLSAVSSKSIYSIVPSTPKNKVAHSLKTNFQNHRSYSTEALDLRALQEFSSGSKMPGEDRGSPSSMSELDSAIGTSTASPGSGRKVNSGCSSMSDREEENFECYGVAEDVDDSETVRMTDEVDANSLRSPPHSLPPSNFTRRNSWVRRSLRCSPSSPQERLSTPRRWGSFRHAPKRVGGTAVASQLYRTSSFSSGRSSVPDQDDMYSDASLEDEYLDLNHKVQLLQHQVGALAENQVNNDDRVSRVKQDNSALQARVMMLEEQLRETEIRSEDRLAEEQRRNKELIARVEREKLLTIENYSIKQISLEKDKSAIVDDNLRLKSQIERLSKENEHLEDKLSDSEHKSSSLNKQNSQITEISKREREELRIERERSSQVIEELRAEVERLRALEESFTKRPMSNDCSFQPNVEMEAEIKQLRNDNKRLLEQIEELQAQLLTSRLEEGRTLVSATNNNSLAAEFEQMTNDEEAHSCSELDKLRKSLKDSQESNQHLKSYIDGILLNIVDNYPQLLEVKQK